MKKIKLFITEEDIEVILASLSKCQGEEGSEQSKKVSQLAISLIAQKLSQTTVSGLALSALGCFESFSEE